MSVMDKKRSQELKIQLRGFRWDMIEDCLAVNVRPEGRTDAPSDFKEYFRQIFNPEW